MDFGKGKGGECSLYNPNRENAKCSNRRLHAVGEPQINIPKKYVNIVLVRDVESTPMGSDNGVKSVKRVRSSDSVRSDKAIGSIDKSVEGGTTPSEYHETAAQVEPIQGQTLRDD